MAEKPVIPKSRKTVEHAKEQAARDTVKKVEKAAGARGSTLGNIDFLVNKYLATFRNAEKTLADVKALVETYREKYPELTDYIPRTVEKRGYRSERMPRMSRRVHISSTFALGGESSGMRSRPQTSTSINKWTPRLGPNISRNIWR